MGVRKRVALIADSNFLMMLASGAVAPSQIIEALESSYILLVPRSVVEELRRVARSAPQASTRRLASRALWLLESGKIDYELLEDEPPKGDIDDHLVELAAGLAGGDRVVVVATSDRGLRRKLRRRGIPSLYYREDEGGLRVEWLPP